MILKIIMDFVHTLFEKKWINSDKQIHTNIHCLVRFHGQKQPLMSHRYLLIMNWMVTTSDQFQYPLLIADNFKNI